MGERKAQRSTSRDSSNWIFEICLVSWQFGNISRVCDIRGYPREHKLVMCVWCCLQTPPQKLDSSRMRGVSQSWIRSRPRHMGGDRASEHPCLSEAKIPSPWHNFNILSCKCGSTFTSFSVSTWDPGSNAVVLLCLLLLWAVFWVRLLFPLSSVGWCCLAHFIFGWCCVFPSPFAWCCLPFPSPLACSCLPSPPTLGGPAFSSSSVGWCFASSFRWVFWVELLFPLSSVGWCWPAPSEKEKWKKKTEKKFRKGPVPKTLFDPPRNRSIWAIFHGQIWDPSVLTNLDPEKKRKNKEKIGKNEENKRTKRKKEETWRNMRRTSKTHFDSTHVKAKRPTWIKCNQSQFNSIL